jgi:hypothetical protein
MRQLTTAAALSLIAGAAAAADPSTANEDTILDLIEKNYEFQRSRSLTGEDTDLSSSKIWIHIRNPAQRAEATKITEVLGDGVSLGPVRRDIDWRPVQQVTVGPDDAQVRYFKDEDRATANEIARRLTEAGIATRSANFVDAFKDVSYIDVGHIEIWLGDEAGAGG